MKKISLLLICGGASPEHEISIISARSNLHHLISLFNLTIVCISKCGIWYLVNSQILNTIKTCTSDVVKKEAEICSLININNLHYIRTLNGREILIDVAFPLVHGIGGEDGTLQGLLESVGVRYIGSGVDGSVICMNKSITKKILESHGVRVVPALHCLHHNLPKYNEAIEKLQTQNLFIKPAKNGSSVGVYKINNEIDYNKAIEDVKSYGNTILIEKCIVGKEIECAVIGNKQDKIISVAGEILLNDCDFYSYNAKYGPDSKKSSVLIPARITEEQMMEIKKIAGIAFDVLYCRDWARVDFFIDENGLIYLNELNTIPGCTSISMYTKLLTYEGISPEAIFKRLVQLAIHRETNKQSVIVTDAKNIQI